jgi:hypothetical protein
MRKLLHERSGGGDDVEREEKERERGDTRPANRVRREVYGDFDVE